MSRIRRNPFLIFGSMPRTHEPCATRGECYHSRGGRIGSREAKARGGRIGMHKMRETWGKTLAAHEARVRGGRIGARNQPRGARVRAACNGARKLNATWGKTFEAYEARSRGARNGSRETRVRGGIKTAELLRQKPNRQESTIAALLMTFHPDVWADTIWQRRLPRDLRGVPDLQHPIGVVGEYDGGAHHIHKDRSTDDAAKDIERRTAGYAVVRETDPYVLVAKFAYAVLVKFS